jgi:hypothetical protein
MNFLKNIPAWKKFPDTQTLGYYSPMGNYICLNEYKNETEFQTALQNPSLDKNKFSVFIHEMQHYYDNVSTLWGVQNLYKLFRAYDAVIKYDEYEFYKFREVELNFKRDYFLDYYTETYSNIIGNSNDRWGFDITSGVRFSPDGKINEDLPILFVKFSSSKKEKISRVPLSVVSLLETTATYSEFNFLLSEALKLESPFRENQIKSISSKFESLLYNPELTLYSVAVHVVSVNLQISDPIKGYEFSSLFAKIALNIPSNLFQTIKIHSEFDIKEQWKHRAKKMLENQERGFAFYLLVKNYVAVFGTDTKQMTVENILKASNLPTEQEIEKAISEEIQALDLQILLEKNNLNRGFIDKVFWGNKFREVTGIGQQNAMTDLSKFERDKPYLIFQETYFEYENLNLETIIDKLMRQQKINIDEWFRFYTWCEKRIDSFNTICGI